MGLLLCGRPSIRNGINYPPAQVKVKGHGPWGWGDAVIFKLDWGRNSDKYNLMDYSVGAIKVFAAQLSNAQPAAAVSCSTSISITGPAMTLGTLLFQRVWLQGMLVAGREHGCLVLDDGSSTIEIFLSKDFLQQQWKRGMYVMVIGAYTVNGSGSPVIKVHKIVDLSSFPNREAMWHLEVIEAYEMFYKSSIVD